MKDGKEAGKTICWQTLTGRHMPPLDERVLIWRGLSDKDGGFPCVGRLCRDTVGDCYLLISASGRDVIVTDETFRNHLWSPIPMPDRAARKRERERQRHEG